MLDPDRLGVEGHVLPHPSLPFILSRLHHSRILSSILCLDLLPLRLLLPAVYVALPRADYYGLALTSPFDP